MSLRRGKIHFKWKETKTKLSEKFREALWHAADANGYHAPWKYGASGLKSYLFYKKLNETRYTICNYQVCRQGLSIHTKCVIWHHWYLISLGTYSTLTWPQCWHSLMAITVPICRAQGRACLYSCLSLQLWELSDSHLRVRIQLVASGSRTNGLNI